MDYFKQLLTRIGSFVRQMSVSQVVMLVAIVVGSVMGLVAVAGWMTAVTYQPLYSNLESAEAAEVTGFLAEKKISYKITGNGSVIEVPEGDLYEARMALASEGLPHSGTVGYSIFDETNLGMTEFLQKLNFRRALEGELSRTITALNEVQAARVHIVIPEDRLFSEQQEEATASVVLKLKHRNGLSQNQLAGISHLVAASVEGLHPGNITVIDYDGNLLSSDNGGDEMAAMSATQIDLAQQVERDLERKAQTMLDGVLGAGKSIVRVTAELNFDQYSRTSENYDPNTVVRSEQKTETSDLATKTLAEEAEDKTDTKSEVTVTNYEVSKSVEAVTKATGTVRRLSVAVLLDGNYNLTANEEGAEELVYEPRPQDEMDRLGSIVKNAVGFQPDRNDQIEVVNIAFDKQYLHEHQEKLDEQINREFYLDLAKKLSLLAVAILAFLWLRKKLKRFFGSLAQFLPSYRPPATAKNQKKTNQGKSSSGDQGNDTEEEEVEDEEELVIERRQPKLIDKMQNVARKDPTEIAKVIRTMMVE